MSLAKQKKILQIKKLEAVSLEFELKILERQEDIDRIKKLKIENDKTIEQVQNELASMEG